THKRTAACMSFRLTRDRSWARPPFPPLTKKQRICGTSADTLFFDPGNDALVIKDCFLFILPVRTISLSQFWQLPYFPHENHSKSCRHRSSPHKSGKGAGFGK